MSEWTVENIKARWIEAADVERRLHVKGLPTSGNAWPAYCYDKTAWDDQAHEDFAEMWRDRRVTRSDELSRWGEVYFGWTLRFVPEGRRELVWAWSRCNSGVDGRSFSKVCETHGWVKSTSFLRVERTFESLVSQLCIALIPFRPAAHKWSGQSDHFEHDANPIVGSCDQRVAPKIHPPFRAESPRHLLKTDAAIAEFEEHLADVNEARRKARLRKALRGVPGEEAAA